MKSLKDHYKHLVPIHCQETPMQANFTFTNTFPSNVECKSPIPSTSTLHSASPSVPQNGAKWQWRDRRSECFVECGHQGMSMKYETRNNGGHSSPEAIRSPALQSNSSFCRVTRPYERRCRSTAHIVLQQDDFGAAKYTNVPDSHGRTKHDVTRSQHSKTKKSTECPNTTLNPNSLSPCPNCSLTTSQHLNHYDSRHCRFCSCTHCITLQKIVNSLSHDCHHYNHPCHHPVQPTGPTHKDHSCQTNVYCPTDFQSSSVLQQPTSRHNDKMDNAMPTKEKVIVLELICILLIKAKLSYLAVNCLVIFY